MRRRIKFWITSEDLFSSLPSVIQAMEATMNITNPATVMRAFIFAATIAAARMVVQAAKVLSMASSSMPLRTAKSPFSAKVKDEAVTTWVKPSLVAEVKFTEWTKAGEMRHPVYLGLRADKQAKDVVREQETPRD